MPYRTIWVKPEVFLIHQGVTVYHTYKNDDWEEGPQRYSFTTDPEWSTIKEAIFTDPQTVIMDVREIETISSHKLKEHPVTLNSPEYRAMSPSAQKAVEAQWKQWYAGNGIEEQIIVVIVKEAVESGILKAPEKTEINLLKAHVEKNG